MKRGLLVVCTAALLAACGGSGAVARQSPSPSPSPSAAATAPPPPSPSPLPQEMEASLPAPRQEVASAADSSQLVVVGGFDSSRRDTSTVFVFRGAWSRGPDYPLPVDHASAAELDGTIYVAGGNSLGVAQPALYRFDGTGWTRLRPLHHPRGALALVASSGRLYALGGVAAGAEVAAVESYDPGADSWTDVASLPDPRDHGAGFAWDGLACLAGGRSPNTARVDCFDPAKGAWSRLPDLPAATSGAGAANLRGRAIVAGGEDAAESTLVNHVFRLDPGTAAWTDEPMLIPRHGVQLAAWGSRAYACGGATAAGYQATPACTSIT